MATTLNSCIQILIFSRCARAHCFVFQYYICECCCVRVIANRNRERARPNGIGITTQQRPPQRERRRRTHVHMMAAIALSGGSNRHFGIGFACKIRSRLTQANRKCISTHVFSSHDAKHINTEILRVHTVDCAQRHIRTFTSSLRTTGPCNDIICHPSPSSPCRMADNPQCTRLL